MLAPLFVGEFHLTFLGEFTKFENLVASAYGEGIYGRSMSILARCHMELGDLDSALYYARLADVMKVPGTDPYGYATYKLIMATVHAARGESDVAEPYYKRALAVADSAGTLDALIGGSAGYAKLLIGQARAAEALAWARKGFSTTDEVRQPALMIRSTTALSDAFAANGMTDSALVYSKLAHAWRDSLTALQNKSQLQNQLFAQELKDREDCIFHMILDPSFDTPTSFLTWVAKNFGIPIEMNREGHSPLSVDQLREALEKFLFQKA